MFHTAIWPSLSLSTITRLLRTSFLAIIRIWETFLATRFPASLEVPQPPAPGLRSPALICTITTVTMCTRHLWTSAGGSPFLPIRTPCTGRQLVQPAATPPPAGSQRPAPLSPRLAFLQVPALVWLRWQWLIFARGSRPSMHLDHPVPHQPRLHVPASRKRRS